MNEIFSQGDIEVGLKELPGQIGVQAELTNEARVKYEKAKAEVSRAKAKAYLTLDGKTVAEKEARVEVDEGVQSAINNEIDAKGNWEAQRISLEQLNNKFVAIRKAASLIEIQFNSTNNETN